MTNTLIAKILFYSIFIKKDKLFIPANKQSSLKGGAKNRYPACAIKVAPRRQASRRITKHAGRKRKPTLQSIQSSYITIIINYFPYYFQIPLTKSFIYKYKIKQFLFYLKQYSTKQIEKSVMVDGRPKPTPCINVVLNFVPYLSRWNQFQVWYF